MRLRTRPGELCTTRWTLSWRLDLTRAYHRRRATLRLGFVANFSRLDLGADPSVFSCADRWARTCGRAEGFARRWRSIAERRRCKRIADTLKRQRCGLRALPR